MMGYDDGPRVTISGRVRVLKLELAARVLEAQGYVVRSRSEIVDIAIGVFADLFAKQFDLEQLPPDEEGISAAFDILKDKMLLNVNNETTRRERHSALQEAALQTMSEEGLGEYADEVLVSKQQAREWGAIGGRKAAMKGRLAASTTPSDSDADSAPGVLSYIPPAEMEQILYTQARLELTNAFKQADPGFKIPRERLLAIMEEKKEEQGMGLKPGACRKLELELLNSGAMRLVVEGGQNFFYPPIVASPEDSADAAIEQLDELD